MSALLEAIRWFGEGRAYISEGLRPNCFGGYSSDHVYRFHIGGIEDGGYIGAEGRLIDIAKKCGWVPSPEVQEQMDRESAFIDQILTEAKERRAAVDPKEVREP